MCIKYFRYCEICKKLYKIDNCTTNSSDAKTVVHIFEKFCFKTYCNQFNVMWAHYDTVPLLDKVGKSCGIPKCKLTECRIKKIDQKCCEHEENQDNTRYILTQV